MRVPCTVACEACDLWEICRIDEFASPGTHRGDRRGGCARPLATGDFLFRADQPATSLFAVRRGSLKSVRISADGEEHVVAFHLPGDVLGLEALSVGQRRSDVIALESSSLCELPVTRLNDWMDAVPGVARSVLRLLGSSMANAIDQPVPTRGSVWQRVNGFLGDISTRLERRGLDGGSIWLSMSRRDIANYLDVRLETISRAFRRLREESGIDQQGRLVVFRRRRGAAG